MDSQVEGTMNEGGTVNESDAQKQFKIIRKVFYISLSCSPGA